MTTHQGHAWAALVRSTAVDERMERGRIAVAFQAIRRAHLSDGLREEDLPAEIEWRAELYRHKWPELTLTPTALARHWYRVLPKRSALEEWRKRPGNSLHHDDDYNHEEGPRRALGGGASEE